MYVAMMRVFIFIVYIDFSFYPFPILAEGIWNVPIHRNVLTA